VLAAVLVFAMAGDEQTNSPKDFNECVSRAQLQAAMKESQRGMNDAIKKAVTDALIDLKLGSSIERLDRRISALTDKVTELENRLPNEDDMGGNNTDEDAAFDKDGNIDAAATRTAMLRRHLRENRRGMGGHQHQGHTQHASDDPYAKVKFTIPPFLGHYDVEGYLDPERHRVRQASSEFKDFAIIWWSGLAAENALPTTWERLKVAMRDRFVPPSYHRDLCKKLMRLE
jgi:hypothetical protein